MGDDFPYVYYLAVVSALKVHDVDKVNIWLTETPKSKYFDLLKSKGKVSVNYLSHVPNFASLRGKPIHWTRASIKDCYQWQLLYVHGGVYLDLDTFSIHDITHLLEDDKEVVATPYLDLGIPMPVFDGAITVVRPNSTIIKQCYDLALAKLNSQDMEYGDSGPITYSYVITHNLDKVTFPKPGVFGELVTDISKVIAVFREDGVIPENACVVHLYASSYEELLSGMDEDFVNNSPLLITRLIKRTLTPDEWCPFNNLKW